MNRIFVYKKITKESEYCIFDDQSSEDFISMINNNYNFCPNIGNKVWFQGIMSAIYSVNNQFGFLSDDTTPEYVNSNFDIVLLPMANTFSRDYIHLIESLYSFFKKITIPTVVISCGVQDDLNCNIDLLIKDIGEVSKKFIYVINNSGGQFGVRGEYTKVFFEKLGFDNTIVTGCPSIYQNGPNLSISNKKVDKSDFKYIINGSIFDCVDFLYENENSVYIDQYSMYELLFKNIYEKSEYFTIKKIVKEYGLYILELLCEDKIQMFPNLNDWRKYIIENQFAFSFGSRIHGSVMSILSGIPTVMNPIDSRTLEMAEFYSIPIVNNDILSKNSLYDIYLDSDFTSFNEKYKENYNLFCKFLIDNKLTDKINNNNLFFDINKPYVINAYPNSDMYKTINDYLKNNYKKCQRLDVKRNIKNRIKTILLNNK